MKRQRHLHRVSAAAAVLATALAVAQPSLAADEPISIRLDTTPAERSIHRSATIRWFAGEGSKLSCSVDNRPFARCSSPLRLKALRPGSHRVRLVATRDGERAQASVSFRVLANANVAAAAVPAPGVTLDALRFATDVRIGLAATINPNGVATSAWFEFGRYETLGHTTPVRSLGNGVKGVALADDIGPTRTDTVYYYRVVAQSAGGTVRSAIKSVRTLATAVPAPGVTTGSATAVTTTSASTSGTVTTNGVSGTAWVQLGESTTYDAATTPVAVTAATTAQGVTIPVAALEPNTTYHFRVVAKTTAGQTAGPDRTFTTLAEVPTANTGGSSSITTSSATVDGTVDPRGASGSAWVEYGTGTGYGSESSRTTVTAAGTVSYALTGLAAGTTYHYRVVVETAGGRASGPDRTFTTGLPAPLVATGASGSITTSGAAVAGSVDPRGGSASVWVQYGTSTAYGAETARTTVSAAGGVSFTLGGLAAGTTYHYRLVAQTAGGTTTGADGAFTTAAAPPPPPPPPPTPTGYFVSPSGDDANPGTQAAPWKTLGKAAAALPAGSTVWLRGGTYAPVVISRSGTSSAWLTFQGYPGETAIIAGSGNPSIPVNVRGHYVAIRNVTVQGAQGSMNSGVLVSNGGGDVRVLDSVIRDNHNFGVRAYQADRVEIRNNLITGNDTGIRVDYNGEGTVIAGNRIVNNDGMVVNDSTAGNDTGANAVVFFRSNGRILATGNTVSGNRAPSIDYGYDGGGFEIFGASNVTMTDNLMFDNMNVLETGTNSGYACANNVFARNTAYGGNDKSKVSLRGPGSYGLILRCAQNMLIANNTLSDLDYWIYDIGLSSSFSSSIDGMRILNNVHAQIGSQIYAIGANVPASVQIDNNVDWRYGGGTAYKVDGKGTTDSLATFRAWTGRQGSGVQADPAFVNRDGRNYRLTTGSAAIDRARTLTGITDGFLGGAPDSGAYELR